VVFHEHDVVPKPLQPDEVVEDGQDVSAERIAREVARNHSYRLHR
jgi:hypothetical protein